VIRDATAVFESVSSVCRSATWPRMRRATHAVQALGWAVPNIDNCARSAHTQLPRLAPPRRDELSVRGWDVRCRIAHVEREERRDGLHVDRIVCRGGQDVDIAIVWSGA